MIRNPQSWRDDATCVSIGPDAFFPEDVYGDTLPGELITRAYAEVKPVCASCPVLSECTEWVMRTEQPHYRHGYVAGMTPNKRDALARARKAAA